MSLSDTHTLPPGDPNNPPDSSASRNPAGSQSPSAQSQSPADFGKALVDVGLLSPDELAAAREESTRTNTPLADLLLRRELITPAQLQRLNTKLAARKPDTLTTGQIPGYQLLGRLGKGAMAVVYKARQLSLDRIVAIKVLPQRLTSGEFVDRFYREGRAAARLSHNNIVQAIDVGSTPEGYHYFVMEYVEGDTLFDVMDKAAPAKGGKFSGSFSESEALDISIQICDALAHAHERGLIHRDVKPKNVLLTPQRVAKLTDLGLARAMNDRAAAEQEAGKAYGTPYYISPEQIRGEVDIDFRADIYSLGATMYHLVTGRPPFDGESPSAVMHKHLKQPLIPADHVNTALSQGVGEIIDFAMAKDRNERYATTRDLLHDLRLVRSGQSPQNARRAIDLDTLEEIEETGKTVDLPAPPSLGVSLSSSPLLMALAIGAAVSVMLNLILFFMLVSR